MPDKNQSGHVDIDEGAYVYVRLWPIFSLGLAFLSPTIVGPKKPTTPVIETGAEKKKRKGCIVNFTLKVFSTLNTITVTVTDGSVVIKIEPP